MRAALALLLGGLLFLAGALPAHAFGIYYARAIGQEYLPEAKPGGLPPGGAAAPELPALGEGAAAKPEERQLSTWTRILIGVALVAAVAALGNGDGGSAQMNVTPGSTPAPPAAPPAGAGGGAGEPLPGAGDNGGGGGGGGLIDVDLDDVVPGVDDDNGNRGPGRGRGRGRGRD